MRYSSSLLAFGLVGTLFLSGCGQKFVHDTDVSPNGQSEQDGPPGTIPDIDSIPEPVPRYEEKSRYGNPPSYAVLGKRYSVRNSAKGYVEEGYASWYGTKFDGRRTSSGEPYDIFAMTAAHKSLPLPTFVEVTNLQNGKRTIVRVNDRGPFHAGRIIDLSYSAATKLGVVGHGTARVRVRAITEFGVPTPQYASHTSPAPKHRTPPPATAQTVAISPAGPQKLFLQVGAFSQESNAQQLADRLIAEALPGAHVAQSQKEGSSLYRVRIGPVASEASAGNISEKLARLGFTDSRLIRE